MSEKKETREKKRDAREQGKTPEKPKGAFVAYGEQDEKSHVEKNDN